MATDNVLEIKNLHTYFYTDGGVIKAVDGVDVELRRGATLGIVGESGSGKSVTSLSVMGLLAGTKGKIADGEILLDGDDIVKLTKEQQRKLRGSKISMIFQEPMTSLNPVMKIGDQVAECVLQHEKISKKRGTEKGRGHAPENGCSACGAYDEGVSVPAFRRPETEGHDCHGTCMQAGNPDCG